MTYFVFLLPVGAIAYLVMRLVVHWYVNRPEPGDGVPVSPEDLAREQPVSVVSEISFEHLDPLLEKIELAIDWGFTESQRSSLIARVDALLPGDVTYAIFPVRHKLASSDLLMHFGRPNHETVVCRFEGSRSLIDRIDSFLRDIPSVSS